MVVVCVVGSIFASASLDIGTVFAGSCSCNAAKISINAAAKLVITDQQKTQAKGLCAQYKGSFDDANLECNNTNIVIVAATQPDCQKNESESVIKQSLNIPGTISPFVSVDTIVCTFSSADVVGAYNPTPVVNPSTPSIPSPIKPSSPSASPSSVGTSNRGLLPEPTGKCPEDYQKGTPANLSQPCANGEQRDYALDDIKSLLARIGNLMLGVSGAIVLFCFVLGGFFWIASAGNPKMVDKGKTLISSAVIGLIIMFSAYTLVVFAVRTLVGSDIYKPGSVGPSAGGTGSSGQVATVKKGTVSSIPPPLTSAGLCEKLASGASCSSVNTCTSSYAIIGACGDVAQECCMPISSAGGAQTTGCGKIGGTCQATSAPCNGPYVAGLCGSGNSNQCCFKVN